MRENNFQLTEAEDVNYMYDEMAEFIENYGVIKLLEIIVDIMKIYDNYK